MTALHCDGKYLMFYLQIPNILFLHEGFLEDLKRRLENWDSKKTIGDWFLDSVSLTANTARVGFTIYLHF